MPSKKALRAWKSARAQSYARRLSPLELASMLVDLEDSTHCVPEFEIDDEWPAEVRHMKSGRGQRV